MASTICEPMVNDGSSAVIGSWKTIDIGTTAAAAHLARGEQEQVLALEQDRARRRPARPVAAGRITASAVIGLAAAALADQAEDLAAVDGERHVLHGGAGELAAVHLDREALDGQRRPGERRVGGARARYRSPPR